VKHTGIILKEGGEGEIRLHLRPESLGSVRIRLAMGVGGLFDFYSGRLPRAPVWMREMGMEWVYRLIQEPGRLWKRYLIGNSVFLFRVTWERLCGSAASPRDPDTEA